MGIGIVLIVYLVIGVLLAATSSLIFAGAATFYTRGITESRRKLILFMGLFPFACLAWAGFIFVSQAIVNEAILGRDMGLGDTWHCPLPNGYQLMMIDVTDQGWVYNPKTQSSSYSVSESKDSVTGVRKIQITPTHILGGIDTKAFDHLGDGNGPVDSYFIIDARTGEKTILHDYESLQNGAQLLGIILKLEPISDVYFRYRWSWFDFLIAVLLFIPPIYGFVMLCLRIGALRKSNGLLPNQNNSA